MAKQIKTVDPNDLLTYSSNALSSLLICRQVHPELSADLQPAIDNLAQLSSRLSGLSFEQVLIRAAKE